MLPSEIIDYLATLPNSKPLQSLIAEVLSVGDTLADLRSEHNDARAIINHVNDDKSIPFKLKHKVGAAEKSPIRHSKTREKLSSPEQETADVLSRDNIKIKPKGLTHAVRFDAAANFKDGNHNWGVHANIEDEDGNLTHSAIYIPEIGQLYFASDEGAHIVSFPRSRGTSQETKFQRIAIGKLCPKFNCEVGSWHTKERAPIKLLFTMRLREEVGGSLRETGMKEAPFPWVALNRLGYAFIGNLKPEDGRSGAFIAAQGGATVMRIPITSDSQGRDIVLAVHPAIEQNVIDYFNQALVLGEDDVTVGLPTILHRNTDPTLIAK